MTSKKELKALLADLTSKFKPVPTITEGQIWFKAGTYTPLEVQLAMDLHEAKIRISYLEHQLEAEYNRRGEYEKKKPDQGIAK